MTGLLRAEGTGQPLGCPNLFGATPEGRDLDLCVRGRQNPPMTPAFLLDLDGTLYTDRGAVPGGPGTIAALRLRSIPFRCVTNTTTRTRTALAARLAGYGYDIAAQEILTPAGAAVAHCRARGFHRIAAYAPEAALEDLAGLELGEAPAAVVIGDLGERWSFALLQQAFAQVMAGAEIIALSKDRYFLQRGALTLDAGPFVAALEYATGRTATVVGKPSPEFYRVALDGVGGDPGSTVMVGDDLWSDVRGAQQAGMRGWLVRTGKFREDQLRESGVVPDQVIDSVADVIRAVARDT